MRINIIGYGTVGKAQELLLKSLGHDVFVFDPYILPEVSVPEKQVELTFICTPQEAVPGVVRSLQDQDVQGLYVIKSTVPVGTTESLMKNLHIHVISNPEFLRETRAQQDVLNPDRIIIGQCCEAHGQKLAALYEPLKKPIFITDATSAETAKLLANAYLSMLITFWNESDDLINKLGLSNSEVARLVCSDARMSNYGTAKFGHPYGGKCLPRCMDELIHTFRGEGLNPLLFEAVRAYNLRIKAVNDNP